MSSLAPPLSAATLRARCAAVVAQARAAGLHAEAFAESERVAEATLRAGELDTLSTIDETVIGLRVWLDGRVGFATTNDPDGLDALLDAAAAVARATPADAAFAPPPGRALGASAAVDPAILALTPGDLAAEALALRDAVRAQDPRVGEVVFSGAFDLNALKAAKAEGPGVGDLIVLRGGLQVGAERIRNISFSYFAGD